MLGLTLTATLPQLHPHPCNDVDRNLGRCTAPSSTLMAVLYTSLGLLTIGAGGTRPCSLPFALDQFDATTEKGKKDIRSFFNWYYLSFSVTIMIVLTVIVYIQDNMGWGIGFGILAAFMLIAVLLFFLGTRLYVHVLPEGSVLSGLAQVVVVAFKKRNVEKSITICDPDPTNPAVTKLHLTQQFKFLNKAALVESANELTSDGFPKNPWSLTSVQNIEELKCVLRIVPILASAVIFFVAMNQQGTFIILQALKMDRYIVGRHFQIPAGSMPILSMIVMIVFIPIYDRVIIPFVAKYTGRKGGITMLQRMGIGMLIVTSSLVSAGIVEKKRRNLAVRNDMDISPMSVLWLGVPLGLSGLAEAFSAIAQLEFYYKEFPYHMRSISQSLFFLAFGASSYFSTFLVLLVQKYSSGRNHNHTDWLANDINSGRLEYFYYLVAFLNVLNLVYFVLCSIFYRYKEQNEDLDDGESEIIDGASPTHKY